MEINKCTFDSAFPIANDEKWNGIEIFTSNFIKRMSQWTRLFLFSSCTTLNCNARMASGHDMTCGESSCNIWT